MTQPFALSRTAHRYAVYPQCRLADTDRHALPILAAGADAGVEGEVVADHRHPSERIGSVAVQCCALDGIDKLDFLDLPRFGSGEHELDVGDRDLASADRHRTKAVSTRRVD